MTEELTGKLQLGVRQLRELEKELSTIVSNRQLLDSQQRENEVVLEARLFQELELQNTGDSIYKLVGSVLLKQESADAKSNVSKRIDFIKNELKKLGGRLKETQGRMEVKEKELIQLQNSLRSGVSTP